MNQKLIKDSVNQRLKIFFESQGISNSMVSEATGISKPSISKMLTGTVDPHKTTIAKITKVYQNLNPNWLFNGEGEMIQEASSAIDWKEEAFSAVKDENTFLKKQLELLNNVVNALLKNPNFPTSPLHVAKLLKLEKGALAGDYQLAS
ncbi:MAG: helix-turn-helix domain-containing protein [Bacteroidia bacterium]|nr:helix-turn-helix domain-containing protein [Bacteroidia bacterium]MCF8427185.1 helix-turn-helix domain-containing protein [Bacteroidia bacterium]MCF8445830.1 helix-turn-helix domain-containing protein [Bacteroidia bacterium]